MSDWPYPADFNPREELKRKSSRYADYISYGVSQDKLDEYDELSDNNQSKMSKYWTCRPIWELWAEGQIYQYYITQWALQRTDNAGELQAVVRFVLRLSNLAEIDSADSGKIMVGLKTDLVASGMDSTAVAAATAAAKSKLVLLHEVTRRTPCDSNAFTFHLSPLLAVADGANVNADEFFQCKDWGFNLCRAVHIVSQQKEHINFTKAVKPLLIGVGGYGLVMLAFDNQTGRAVALKRQNMSMILEKNHAARALLELKIASTIFSPFIIDCPYAYIDGKDLVLALRMLSGGDLAHYLKKGKEEAKKAKLPKTGLSGPAAQFYCASTILALEVLHSHGFIYRYQALI